MKWLFAVLLVALGACSDSKRSADDDDIPTDQDTPTDQDAPTIPPGHVRAVFAYNSTDAIGVCLRGATDIWLARSLGSADVTPFVDVPPGDYELRVVAAAADNCDTTTFIRGGVTVTSEGHASIILLDQAAEVLVPVPGSIALVDALDTTLSLDLFYVGAESELFNEVATGEVRTSVFTPVTNENLRLQLASAAADATVMLGKGITFPAFSFSDGAVILIGATGADMNNPSVSLMLCPGTEDCTFLGATPRVVVRKPRYWGDVGICLSGPNAFATDVFDTRFLEPGTYTTHIVPAYQGCEASSAPGYSDGSLAIANDADIYTLVSSPTNTIEVLKHSITESPKLYNLTEKRIHAYAVFGGLIGDDLGFLDSGPVATSWARISATGQRYPAEELDLLKPLYRWRLDEDMMGHMFFYATAPGDGPFYTICENFGAFYCEISTDIDSSPSRDRLLNLYSDPPRPMRFCHALSGGPSEVGEIIATTPPIPYGAISDYVAVNEGIDTYFYAAEADDPLCTQPKGRVLQGGWATNTTHAISQSISWRKDTFDDAHSTTQWELNSVSTSVLDVTYGAAGPHRFSSPSSILINAPAWSSATPLKVTDVANSITRDFPIGPIEATDIVSIFAISRTQITVCLNNRFPTADGLSACTLVEGTPVP